MEQKIVERKADFVQVCVWPGTLCGPDKVHEFEEYMAGEEGFSVRVQYLEEVKTYPDIKNGKIVHGTGGRNDLMFAVHKDDVGKFAVPRLMAGIRWIEDVYGNGGGNLYPEYVRGYYSWDKDPLNE